MPEQIPDLMTRFKIVGILDGTREVEYGKEGKTMAVATLSSRFGRLDEDPEPCQIELAFFGKKKEMILNAGIGCTVDARGSIVGKKSKTGGMFPTLSVDKLQIFGSPEKAATRQQGAYMQHSRHHMEREAEAAEEAELMF